MRLDELVSRYVAARNAERPLGRELAAKSVEHLTDCVAAYSRYLSRPPETADLQPEQVNDFLRWLISSRASPYTVKNRRCGLRVLWRFAHSLGLAPEWSGVRSVHCPPLSIDGYDRAAMDTLLDYIRTLRGTVRCTSIKRAVWWESFCRTDWCVGLRIGDMLAVTPEHFDTSGWLWTCESKTGKAGWRRLTKLAAESIERCLAADPCRKRIWPGYKRRNAGRAFKELAKRAGIGGTSKFIRRGGSSEAERLYPGSGWKFLRHSTPVVWERYYRVDRICEQGAPLPPELAATQPAPPQPPPI